MLKGRAVIVAMGVGQLGAISISQCCVGPRFDAAYRKYWLQGCPTGDAAVAVDAAASIGYDWNAVREGMQEAETKDRLVFENQEANRRGVFGSPFSIMDGEPFWGSNRIALMRDNPGQDA
jgi:2-hydroxychromene-2-carboxylate isomerase